MPLLDLTNLTERDRNAVTRARLAALVSSSADAIAVATLEGILTDWNPAAERLFGFTAEEAIGQHVAMLTPPERAEEPAQFLAQLRRGESVQGVETVRCAKDGRLVDVSLTLSPIRNDAGQIIATSGIARDITERKSAEHAVAAAHQRTRQLLESTTDGVLLLDRDWHIIDFNPAAEGMFALTHDEVRGRRICLEAVIAEAAPLYAALTQAMVERRPASAEGYYPPVDRWFEVRAYPAPEGLSVFFRDITERKRSQAALQESEARFRAAFENASVGMLLTAPDERTVQVNQALCDILGYSASELRSMTFAEITHPDDSYVTHDDVMRVSTEEGATYEVEKRYLRKDGRIIWALLSGSLLRDEVGAPRYYLSLIQDITERKDTERELRAALTSAQAANRAIRDFLRLMSHELRTPLQVIMGNAELLQQGAAGSLGPEQMEDVEAIHSGARRLAALVTQILDLSRLESGEIALALTPVSLTRIIAAVRRDTAALAAAKGLVLRIDLPPELPLVLGDEMRIYQILLNLVGNAVTFSEAGDVGISAETTPGAVAVMVRGSGSGTAPEVLVHAFEEFRQVEPGRIRRHDGAGLGLTITRRLAELMGGRLSSESQAGAGATFTLHLVRAGATARPAPDRGQQRP